MADLTFQLTAILIGAAFLAGIIDAIAGGGGLITVPALLLCGFSPAQALATNKLQGSFGAGTAAITYARAGLLTGGHQGRLAAAAAIAAGLGALATLALPPTILRSVMPFVLVFVALYFWLKPGLGEVSRPARFGPALILLTLVPIVGFYDGFFGPGAGSFYLLGFVMLAGQGLLQATAQTKVVNLASNLGALAIFGFGGQILWTLGLAMAAAQVAGALLGARLAMRIGAGLIRPLLVVMCFAMATRLLWQVWG